MDRRRHRSANNRLRAEGDARLTPFRYQTKWDMDYPPSRKRYGWTGGLRHYRDSVRNEFASPPMEVMVAMIAPFWVLAAVGTNALLAPLFAPFAVGNAIGTGLSQRSNLQYISQNNPNP